MARTKRPRAWVLGCAALLVCLVGAASASAQQAGNSTLTGTVADRDGVVPGATVTVTAQATNAVRTITTNEVGLFRLPALTPGLYSIKIEMSGFKPITMAGVSLISGETRDIGKQTLQVGGQTEVVTVTAAITPVQVETSARKGELTADELTTVPMKGRDIYGMLALITAVTASPPVPGTANPRERAAEPTERG